MFKIAKKLTVIMLSASIIFSCSGIIAHAEGIKDKKQEYYQEYKRIIREANEKIGSKDFDLLPIDEINEDDMLTPKEFQKAVNAAIQLDTQKPVIDDNGGEYSNESNDNMSARASGETVTESQNKKVSVADNHSVIMKCTATFVTRYNASKKRRFITQIKSAKINGKWLWIFMEEVTYDYKTCDRWWQPLLILLKPDTMHQRLKAIVQDQSKNNS